ncbi:MAG: accessory factor UbiK family protein [Rhodospirillaceae bacterium]
MQSQKRIFDDIAKVAGGALGALGGLKQEVENLVRQRVDRFLSDRDLVTREEFEVVKAMLSEARAEQEKLLKRLETLESGAARSVKHAKPVPNKTASAKTKTAAKSKRSAPSA